MTPDDRRHGTYAGAQQHIRDGDKQCEPCRLAFRRYQRRSKRDADLGLARVVPIVRVVEHVESLRRSGMTIASMSERSGVSQSTIQELLTKPRRGIRKDNAEAILSVRPEPTAHAVVSSTGTIRRVQALGRLGWSMSRIAGEATSINPEWTVTYSTLRQLLAYRYDVIHFATAEAVSAAYDKLAMTLPDPSRQVTCVRIRAERKGWLPPLAWNDIDDAAETPATKPTSRPKTDVDPVVILRVMAGDRLPMTRAERVAVVRQMTADGWSQKRIEEHTGITKVDRFVEREAS